MEDFFEQFIRFPVILVDSIQASIPDDVDEIQRIIGNEVEGKYPEFIIGKAEVPYSDLSHIVDVWIPTKESYENAKNGIFDACMVKFNGRGTFLVPMAKKEFKKYFNEFSRKYEETLEEQVKQIQEELEKQLEEKFKGKVKGVSVKKLVYNKKPSDEQS